jgi:sulfur dioxygenase
MSKMNFDFIQLFEPESSTFTYVLVDRKTRETVIIDPVAEMLERDLKLIKTLELNPIWLLETHIHADHVTSAGPLRLETGAKIALSSKANIKEIDRPLSDGDVISFGTNELVVWETPGHTSTCLSFVMADRIFTGDALLIRATGRTDFQEGDSNKLFESIHKKIFTLPDHITVYPAHNYQGIHSTTIGWEKAYNPRVGEGKSVEEFDEIMKALNLPYPKKIDLALPGNLKLGL